MIDIAGALLVIGLAAISVFAYLKTGGERGSGWGMLAFLVLILWEWN